MRGFIDGNSFCATAQKALIEPKILFNRPCRRPFGQRLSVFRECSLRKSLAAASAAVITAVAAAAVVVGISRAVVTAAAEQEDKDKNPAAAVSAKVEA